MKLSESTIEVLNNFSLINRSLVFKAGNVIKTISPTKTILASAKVEDTIPSEFGIYDLSMFLGVVGLFDDPEFLILDKSMTISQDKESVGYVFAAPSMIMTPPDKELKLPDPEIQFDLSNDILKRVLKVSNTLGTPEIAVSGDRESVYLECLDVANKSNNTYKVKIAETDKQFKMVFLLENIKMLPRDYKVEISSKGMAKFSAENIEYFVTTEAKSSSYDG